MTDQEQNKQARLYEQVVEIDASPDSVWRAITEAEELMRWFPLEARVKPGPGGSMFLSWGSECQGEAPITVWEPGRRLQWTEFLTPPGTNIDPVNVRVDFHIEGRGGKTVLRLVHSGMGPEERWDGYFDSISRGWKFELRGLKHYLERHAGRPRRVLWVRQRTDLPLEEVMRRVLGPEAQVLRGETAGLGEGDACRLTFAAPPISGAPAALEGVVRVNGLPKSFAMTAANLNEAYFRFEIEDMGAGLEAWLWLSTYELADETFAAIEQAWQNALQQALRHRNG